jgi:heme/copper-type cytochrome/quinol oxidase subunit 2
MSSFLGTLKAVSWSFFGIRKNSESQKDVEKLNPMHIIIMAIALVIVMVAGLIGLVNVVVSK